MPRFVNSHEAEISILSYFTIFFPIDDEGGVVGSAKFCAVDVVDGEGDGLAAEPVADVVGVAVVEGDADGVVEDHFEVREEIGVGEVTGLLEGVVDVVVRVRII